MANPSLQIGNSNWAIKEDNLLGYSTAGTRFVPQPITMTRASAGTRVNSSGLVETVELLGSEEVVNGDFELNSNWNNFGTPTTSEQSTEQSHTGTYSWKVIADATQEGIFSPNNFSITNGNSYSVSLWIYSVSGDSIKSGLNNTNVSVFTERTVIAGQWTNITYEATATSTGASYISILSQNSLNFYIDNVSVKESTKNNLARVDYDGTASSLLVEPERTNVNTYSEDFSQSFYIKDSGVSVGTTNNISPSGESNATKIDVTDNGRIYANVASDTYAASVFIKAGTFAYFKFLGSNVDLVAGTFSGGTIESFGNGWFKITKQYTGNRPFQIQAYPDGTYSSHTTTGDYYIWGSQIEAGSYATSYIPTDGGTVTRVKDQYSKTGISNLINSEEGVFFVEMAALSDEQTYRRITLSDGTSSNNVVIRFSTVSNIIQAIITSGGGGSASLYTSSYDITNFNKIAVKWKVNDFALWINGVEIGTDTSGATPIGLDKLAFDNGTNSQYINSKVKQLQVFKTALTDTELATLTTI